MPISYIYILRPSCEKKRKQLITINSFLFRMLVGAESRMASQAQKGGGNLWETEITKKKHRSARTPASNTDHPPYFNYKKYAIQDTW